MRKTILAQDDCAPDAREAFEKEFKKKFGVDFGYWKENIAERSSPDDGYTVQYVDMERAIMVQISADHQFYTVHEIEQEKEIDKDDFTIDQY